MAEENGIFPELAIIAALGLPYGSEEFKTSFIAPSFLLAASHTLSEGLSLGYNLGAVWDGENPEAIGKYSAALGWSTIENLGVFAEVFGTFNKDIGAHAFDFGATYLLSPTFQIDASAGFALNNYAEDFFIAIGFSWRID